MLDKSVKIVFLYLLKLYFPYIHNYFSFMVSLMSTDLNQKIAESIFYKMLSVAL